MEGEGVAGVGILLRLVRALNEARRANPALPWAAVGPSSHFISSLRRALESCPEELQRRPVLLTQPDVRRFVRKLIESELPGARVVTFSELLPETTIRAAGTATLRG